MTVSNREEAATRSLNRRGDSVDFSMFRLTVFVLLVACVASAKPPRIEVQGHRGARAAMPENSLAAFDYALKMGVDTLELDVGVTIDGHVVVLHDPAIDPMLCLGPDGRTLKEPILVNTLAMSEVERFDCGTLPHPRFETSKRIPGTRIPTLAQVFELVHDSKHPAARRVQFNIETKIVPGRPDATLPPEPFAKRVLQVVSRFKMESRTVLQSFDQRTLLAAQRIAPTVRRAILVAENFVDHVAVAKAAKASIVSPHKLWITREAVARCQAAGLRVIPWTANDVLDWDRLVKLGVDGIITDDPGKLIAYLKKRGLR